LNDFFWNYDKKVEKLPELFSMIRSKKEALIIIKIFFKLSVEEQSRFLAWLAGIIISRNNEDSK